MMEEPEETRLDQTLRNKFEDFNLSPDGRVWTDIEQRIATPAPMLRVRRRPVPLPFLFGLTALLAGLLGWLLPHGTRPEAARVAMAAPAAGSAEANQSARGTSNQQLPSIGTAASRVSHATSARQRPVPVLSRNQAILRSILAEKQERALAKSHLISAPDMPVPAAATASTAIAAPQPENTLSSATAGKSTSETTSAPAIDTAFTAAAPEAIPATLRALANLEHQRLTQLPSITTLAPGTPPAGSHAALLANLRAERAELLRLQRRTDSTLLALGDLPSAPRPTVAAAPPFVDTATVRPLSHRWSLLFTATPEQNALNLQAPAGDRLTELRRNHETGRAGFNAALTAEYRLTPRLSVGGGVGYSTYGADLRITSKKTDITVAYDTAVTKTTRFYTSTNRTYSIRIIQVPQLSPIFNSSGQVIGYNTVYVPRPDTVFTTTVQRDSVHSISNTVTPRISKKETVSTKLLQPNYRFFTVPLMLRYRLTTGPGRWWADVAAGGQLQFFLGGTQVVTDDGENFRLETIRAGEGPFRAVNVALSGSLALNYALTNRLSVSVAPSMRWQALSVYKFETGLRQQPTATGLMFGVRFGL